MPFAKERLLRFIILQICFKEITTGTQDNCPVDSYVIIDSKGIKQYCFQCHSCHEGSGLFPNCGKKLTESEKKQIDCKDCVAGETYSDDYDHSSCKLCSICSEKELVNRKCTVDKNSICSKTCQRGYYFDNLTTHGCNECSYCCNDDKDIRTNGCKDMPENKQCSILRSMECTPSGGVTNPSIETSTKRSPAKVKTNRGLLSSKEIAGIAIGSFCGVLILVAVVLFFVYLIRIRRCRSRSRNRQKSTSTTTTSPLAVDHESQGLLPIIATSHESQTLRVNPESERILDCQDIAITTTTSSSAVESQGLLPIITTPHELQTLSLRVNPESEQIQDGQDIAIHCTLMEEDREPDELHFEFHWEKDGAKLDEKSPILKITKIDVLGSGCYTCQVSRKNHKENTAKSCDVDIDVTRSDEKSYRKIRELYNEKDFDVDKFAYLLVPLKSWKTVAKFAGIEDHIVCALEEGESIKAAHEVSGWLSASTDKTVFELIQEIKYDHLIKYLNKEEFIYTKKPNNSSVAEIREESEPKNEEVAARQVECKKEESSNPLANNITDGGTRKRKQETASFTNKDENQSASDGTVEVGGDDVFEPSGEESEQNDQSADVYCPRHSLGSQRIMRNECLFCGVDRSVNTLVAMGHDTKIDNFVKNLGLKRKKVSGDGHCILHAFSLGLEESLYSEACDIKSLLPKIRSEILDNLDTYKPYYMYEQADLGKELENYLNENQYNSGIVDLMLYVLANLTHTSAKVFYVSNEEVKSQLIPPTKVKSQRTIYLSKVGQHYDALLKVEKKFNNSRDDESAVESSKIQPVRPRRLSRSISYESSI